jgi:hypothetical protein
MSELKFCRDCKHYLSVHGTLIEDQCHHPSNTRIDLVTGRVLHDRTAKGMRYEGQSCSMSGLLFAPLDGCQQ